MFNIDGINQEVLHTFDGRSSLGTLVQIKEIPRYLKYSRLIAQGGCVYKVVSCSTNMERVRTAGYMADGTVIENWDFTKQSTSYMMWGFKSERMVLQAL